MTITVHVTKKDSSVIRVSPYWQSTLVKTICASLCLLVSSQWDRVKGQGSAVGQPRREKKAEMLTGTWLERAKVLAGLFFLLLLLLVLPPPELMVLPPDIFRFRRLLGCCRAGSAVPEKGN